MRTLRTLSLAGTYSLGKTTQWDGLPTPAGFLLRWFVDPTRGFPQLGFDVYRAALYEGRRIEPAIDKDAPRFLQVSPSTGYNVVNGAIAINGAGTSLNGTTLVSASPVFSFSQLAWLIKITAASNSGQLTVYGFYRGQLKCRQLLTSASPVSWCTQGLDTITFEGTGQSRRSTYGSSTIT